MIKINMDLQTLKYFCTVCQEGSFLSASRKLNYAQSNLSARVAQLEKKLGCVLLIRRKSGVVPTKKGFVLLEYARKILRLTEKAESAVQTGQAAESRLAIGSMESTAITFLPALLKTFHTICPDTKVSVCTGTSAATVQKVLNNELDGSFIAGGSIHAELSSVSVRTEKLVLVSNHTLEAASLTELLQQPLVVFPYGCFYRHILENLLAEQNILPDHFIDMVSIGALISSISAGLGIGLLPESAIRVFSFADLLSIHQIPEPYCHAEVKFVYHRDSDSDRPLGRFIEVIQQGLPEYQAIGE